MSGDGGCSRHTDVQPRQHRDQPRTGRPPSQPPRASLLHHQLPPDRVVQDGAGSLCWDIQHVRPPPDPNHNGHWVGEIIEVIDYLDF